MARLGDGEFPSARPGDPSRGGNDKDIVRLAGLSELLLLLFPLLLFDIFLRIDDVNLNYFNFYGYKLYFI